MVEHRIFSEIGGTTRDWLKAKHHFAIGKHGNPAHHPAGVLYVWNDDEVAPHSGFPPHSHSDVEIITYVREGTVTHKDSLGNCGEVSAGEVQVMSAGTGIQHSERNEHEAPARLFQIWIRPRRSGGSPQWASQPFPRSDRSNRFVPLASGRSLPHALPIRADADVYGAVLKAGVTREIALAMEDVAYLVPAVGCVQVNGLRIGQCEGALISKESLISVTAVTDAELALVIAGPVVDRMER
jgi:quercetin 2,3-dioxygenase